MENETPEHKTIEATSSIETNTATSLTGNPWIEEVGHFNTELLIFTLQFSFEISPDDYIVSIDGEPYECVHQADFMDRLYCFGPYVNSGKATIIIESPTNQGDFYSIELDLTEIQQENNR